MAPTSRLRRPGGRGSRSAARRRAAPARWATAIRNSRGSTGRPRTRRRSSVAPRPAGWRPPARRRGATAPVISCRPALRHTPGAARGNVNGSDISRACRTRACSWPTNSGCERHAEHLAARELRGEQRAAGPARRTPSRESGSTASATRYSRVAAVGRRSSSTPPGRQHAGASARYAPGPVEVLDHLERQHGVERAVGVRQRWRLGSADLAELGAARPNAPSPSGSPRADTSTPTTLGRDAASEAVP